MTSPRISCNNKHRQGLCITPPAVGGAAKRLPGQGTTVPQTWNSVAATGPAGSIMRGPHQDGQAAIITAIIILAGALLIAFSLILISLTNQRIVRAIIQSSKSYYAAEAGIEDSLLRVTNSDLSYQNNNTLDVGGNTATITIAEAGADFTVTSEGNAQNHLRKVSVQLRKNTNSTNAQFIYGVQVGDGGLFMQNTSRILGNIYSNGSAEGNNEPSIDGDAWVAASGGPTSNSFSGITVGGSVHANRIKDSVIGGDAYYQTIVNTTVGGTEFPGSEDPEALDMPISDQQIQDWKDDAAAGGQQGSLILDDGAEVLGPIKINGDLKIQNLARLTLTGVVWVTGDVTLQNDAALELDDSFGTASGLLIADGTIILKNDFAICGSGGYNSFTDACNDSGSSYVMLLSTNAGDPAIELNNSAKLQGIVYASDGFLKVQNDADLKEATAYGMRIQNDATVTYETGLQSIEFSTGPSGSWDFLSWREIE